MKPDIGAVLESYSGMAPPHRAGWAPMCCPFHDDRHASAAINSDEGRFHCFVCGIHEDAIGLIMEREGCDFQNAVAQAETITGQSIEGVSEQRELGGWFPDRARNRKTGGAQMGTWRSSLAGALT